MKAGCSSIPAPRTPNGWKLDGIKRGGHLPGAVDFPANWLDSDREDKAEILSAALREKGIEPRRHVVLYSTDKRDRDRSGHLSKLDQVITRMQRLKPPSPLAEYHEHLLSALRDQRKFFDAWHRQGARFAQGNPRILKTHPMVRSSSKALRAAYGELMRRYQSVDRHNQEAFFDYHCALDFI